ncbi:MAG TPA: CapA family protein [Bacteroidales bacterium]|nr:CapA family protein [Bacteroidales bacterium]
MKRYIIFPIVLALLSLSAPLGATTDTLTVALVGDIMLGNTYPKNRLPANDGNNLFDHTRHILSGADIAAGNLEGAMCIGGTCTKSLSNNRSYAFKMPPEYRRHLADAGFDFLSLANNHINDFSAAGRAETMANLDKVGIGYAGLPESRSAFKEVKGVRFGFCAFGYNSYVLKHTNEKLVREIIEEVRAKCDILIVSFHGGDEGSHCNPLPYGTEYFHGENRGDLRKFAHLCIDLGADIVFGHGPHVTRAVEGYKGRIIAYSLGNFCTSTGMNVTGNRGHSPILEVKVDRNGVLLGGKIHSFKMKFGAGPEPDPTNSVAQLMKKLSESDIKNNLVRILEDGSLVVTPYEETSTSESATNTPWKGAAYPTKEFLIGKHTYGKDTNFINIPSEYTELSKENSYIQKPVLAAYEQMYADAKADGIILRVTSASRNFYTQKHIWESKIKEYSERYPDPVECAKKVLKYNSLPGTSRHHWGTDLDFISKRLAYWNSAQGKKTYSWLQTNAHKYGFFQPYGEGRSSGHSEEKWHWSYYPLSELYLAEYLKVITASDLKGFKSDFSAEKFSVIRDYVQGIAAADNK